MIPCAPEFPGRFFPLLRIETSCAIFIVENYRLLEVETVKKKIIWIVVIALVLSLATVCGIFHEEIWDFLFPVKNDWDEKDGIIYYKDSEGDPVTGWFRYEGISYYMDPEQGGAMVTGWKDVEQSRYYFSETGQMLTGWQEIGGADYYLGTDGAMATGWLEQPEGTYYLNQEGNPAYGWLYLEEGEYHLDETGLMTTGWLQEDGKRFYFDDTGLRLTGIVHTGDTISYLTQDGTVQSGWLMLDENTYYLDELGNAFAGWLEEEGLRYYFSPETGAMVTGWLDTQEGRYFLGEDGTMTTGWIDWEEARYHLGETGLMTTGWLEDEGRTYYMREDGTMATGKVTVGESTYYFTSAGSQLILVNRWNPVPEDYEPELVNFNGWKVDAACYDDLVRMLKDCPYGYEITSAYRSKASQQSIWDRRLANYQASGYSYAGALQMVESYVAVPGTSEHQLGLAVDISGANAQKWLEEHCWEYGFILRYLDGKSEITGINYEKWHFRYVGVELAMEMKDTGLCLEEYIDLLTNDGSTCGNPELAPKAE